MGTHEVVNLQHNGPKFLIILRNQGPLPQVKQPKLMAQGMVKVTEFGFQCMAKILPRAYTQPCPILISYRSPPGLHLSREQGDSHLDNLHQLCHPRHFTKLLDVEHPIYQFLGIPIKLLGLLLFII